MYASLPLILNTADKEACGPRPVQGEVLKIPRVPMYKHARLHTTCGTYGYCFPLCIRGEQQPGHDPRPPFPVRLAADWGCLAVISKRGWGAPRGAASRKLQGEPPASSRLLVSEEHVGSGLSTVAEVTWLSMSLWRQMAPGIKCTRSDLASEPYRAWVHAQCGHLLCAPRTRLLHVPRSGLLGVRSSLTYSCTPAVQQSPHVSVTAT